MALTREILFRGQTRKYGEKIRMGTGEKLPGQWVYGGIFPGTGDFSVIYGWESEEEQTGGNLKKLSVYSDTVGQYTGMTDKNGTKIFEGDILKGAWNERIAVYYDTCYLAFRARTEAGFEKDISYYDNGRLEVVGNIYDNPELLKETRWENHHER